MKTNFIINDDYYGLVEVDVTFDVKIKKEDYKETVIPIIKMVSCFKNDELVEDIDSEFIENHKALINSKISEELISIDNFYNKIEI